VNENIPLILGNRSLRQQILSSDLAPGAEDVLKEELDNLELQVHTQRINPSVLEMGHLHVSTFPPKTGIVRTVITVVPDGEPPASLCWASHQLQDESRLHAIEVQILDPHRGGGGFTEQQVREAIR